MHWGGWLDDLRSGLAPDDMMAPARLRMRIPRERVARIIPNQSAPDMRNWLEQPEERNCLKPRAVQFRATACSIVRPQMGNGVAN